MSDSKIEYIEEDGLTYEVKTYPNGDKYWRYNNKLHRLTGPAVESVDGYKAYLINGMRHRLDGPAVEWSNGGVFYWINGILFKTFEDYKEAAIQYRIKEILGC